MARNYLEGKDCEMEEINVCCPYLRTMKCGDTKEHRHLICKAVNEVISNNDILYKCISDNKWILCSFYKPKKEANYKLS